MTYHCTSSDAIDRVTDALKQEGFGILTEIDVQQTLKKELDVDFRPYRILGACNPPLAYQALQAEDKIGTMLPCNVVVQDVGGGIVEVSAVDPSGEGLGYRRHSSPASSSDARNARSEDPEVC